MPKKYTGVLDYEPFLRIGLDLANLKFVKAKNAGDDLFDHAHDGLSSTTFRSWRSNYGHRPIVVYEAWRRIEDEARSKRYKTAHFFWALHFMKSYDIEDNLAAKFGVTPKTFRKRVKQLMDLLSQEFYSLVSNYFFLF